jgi:hypothetical protein
MPNQGESGLPIWHWTAHDEVVVSVYQDADHSLPMIAGALLLRPALRRRWRAIGQFLSKGLAPFPFGELVFSLAVEARLISIDT